ncbi:MAG: hypothetical protein NW224_12100 [Leptolyngbyaceae cyanobacterium bins.302]|nr:hypothetical protein [Leptolyngbyaceae cyanobacterium bins.302]
MKRFATLIAISVGCCLVAGLGGCRSSDQAENPPTSSAPTPASTTASITASPQSSPNSNSTNSAPNQKTAASEQVPPSSAGSSSQKTGSTPTVPPPTSSRPPLTVEKLKNAEYYFLAKGPIKLAGGKYEEKDTKRTYTMSDVVAYGDINKDGVKDAVTTLKVTIPNTGDFSYLVALVNEAGIPKNVSAEFMGSGIRVKMLKVNSDNSIEAVMDQYQAGDPECCPSLKITQTYKLKNNQTSSPQPTKPKP